MENMTGKVWILGDDIDTDIIIPTEYLAMKTIDDMKQYAFSPLRLFKRTGTGDYQSTWDSVRHCKIFCKNLFQKRH